MNSNKHQAQRGHGHLAEAGSPVSGEAVFDYFGTDEIFKRVVASATEEFSLPIRLLFLSGLAAGLSIGLSFIARTTITAAVPGDTSGLVGNILYPIGFLLIVLGRYQLFTENTLTPVTLVMTRLASIPALLRNWGVVLTANVLGAAIIAFVLATTNLFNAEAAEVARGFAEHGLETRWLTLFTKAIIAGWLVASMVWLVHAARDTLSRFFIVFTLMFMVPSADLYHCIIGACEVLYLVFQGGATIFNAGFNFFLPVVLGNTVGGVLLVAILNYAQTRDARFPERDMGRLELNLKEWLFELHTGHAEPEDSESLARQNGLFRTPSLSEINNPYDCVIGPSDASVTLVQYGDYESDISQQIYELVRDLNSFHDDAVSYIYRHLPLSQRHPHAEHAARAALAAQFQGRFYDMHDKLFRNQEALEDIDLKTYAANLKLSMERFEQDWFSEEVDDILAHTHDTAIASGVREASNLFINGVRYDGPLDLESLREAINLAKTWVYQPA